MKFARFTTGRRIYRHARPRDEGGDTLAIHSGLSVTICGHLVRLDRDEAAKVARVVVEVLDGHVVTGLETEAVRAAADIHAARARRFLGSEWTVVPWAGGGARPIAQEA